MQGNIRKRESRDLEDIMEIWLQANKDAHRFIPGSYWKDHLHEAREGITQAEVYVYEQDGVIRGFAGLQEDYMAGIFVDADHTGKGIGGALLEECLKGRESLSLHVYVKNEKALKFYLKEGFRVADTEVEPATGEKEYFMRWEKEKQT